MNRKRRRTLLKNPSKIINLTIKLAQIKWFHWTKPGAHTRLYVNVCWACVNGCNDESCRNVERSINIWIRLNWFKAMLFSRCWPSKKIERQTHTNNFSFEYETHANYNDKKHRTKNGQTWRQTFTNACYYSIEPKWDRRI